MTLSGEIELNEKTWSSTDARLMSRVFRLAARAAGNVSPNPLVGAVVAKNGRIVGEGYHESFGGPHAEVIALERAGDEAEGADLYVNLEPCSHHGKTPPCADQVIRAGIARVFISNRDPNPLVNGKGLQKLESSGIETIPEVLQDEGEKLNAAYFKFMRTGIPYVTLKWAQSIDGRIATLSGDSQWVSGDSSRKMVHEMRRSADAVLVGAGTIRKDNPSLTVRRVSGKQPLRLVLDSGLEIPDQVNILTDHFSSKTVLFTTLQDSEKLRSFRDRGIRVETVNADTRGQVSIKEVLDWMAGNQLISLLVEGGQGVITTFLKSGMVDRLMVFIAPKLIGSGVEAVGDLDILQVANAIQLSGLRTKNVGDDLVLEAEFPGQSRSQMSD